MAYKRQGKEGDNDNYVFKGGTKARRQVRRLHLKETQGKKKESGNKNACPMHNIGVDRITTGKRRSPFNR